LVLASTVDASVLLDGNAVLTAGNEVLTADSNAFPRGDKALPRLRGVLTRVGSDSGGDSGVWVSRLGFLYGQARGAASRNGASAGGGKRDIGPGRCVIASVLEWTWLEGPD